MVKINASQGDAGASEVSMTELVVGCEERCIGVLMDTQRRSLLPHTIGKKPNPL